MKHEWMDANDTLNSLYHPDSPIISHVTKTHVSKWFAQVERDMPDGGVIILKPWREFDNFNAAKLYCEMVTQRHENLNRL